LVLAYINMANFMDGINAISGLHGLAAGGALAVVGTLAQFEWLTFSDALIAVAFAVFLPWNLNGRLFLGDVGSYLLGASLAAAAGSAIAAGVPPIAALAPLAIYAADTLVVIVRRLARGEQWWEAHRQHVYQRLVDAGVRHLPVAL